MTDEIQWHNILDVGHDRIDFEHKIFLALIKNVRDAFTQHKPREQISRLLQELERYASFHFFSEENIAMERGESQPAFDAHHRIHEYLLKELRGRIRRYDAGDEDAMTIVTFLVDWFGQHTTQDRERVDRFSERSDNEAPGTPSR